MGSLVFNKEDKENIKKSIGLIMDDIRCMWETSQVDRIRIDLNFTNERFSSNNLSLEITDKKIGIHETWYEEHKYFQFERKIGKKSVKKVPNYQLAFNFIKNYDEDIRPRIEEELKKGLNKREIGFEKLEAVKQQYDKHAEVFLELGQSSNPPIVVLSEEEGNNIGTLYLGSRTLKLVVDGPIRIINKTTEQELAHVKKKK